MLKLFYVLFCTAALPALGQPPTYSTANAHAHNDYEQPVPFWDAYNHGFGSIEADIFYTGEQDELLVAHTRSELASRPRRLDSMYLVPLVSCIRKNNGSPYPNRTKKLQILVDVKTSAVPTLKKLIRTLEKYPELTHTPGLQFAISGNRPNPDSFYQYPAYIVFDGEMNKAYSDKALTKITMVSADLRTYTAWNGRETLRPNELAAITTQVEKWHRLKHPVRFWDAPDNEAAWQTLMRLKVDYLNTDKIAALSAFLEKGAKH